MGLFRKELILKKRPLFRYGLLPYYKQLGSSFVCNRKIKMITYFYPPNVDVRNLKIKNNFKHKLKKKYDPDKMTSIILIFNNLQIIK